MLWNFLETDNWIDVGSYVSGDFVSGGVVAAGSRVSSRQFASVRISSRVRVVAAATNQFTWRRFHLSKTS